VLSALRSLILLFTSALIMFLGYGLVQILLPVKMGALGVDRGTLGLILSLYAVGMLIGGIYSKNIIERVGHIRVFAISASLAAVAVLLMGLAFNPFVWGIGRAIMGFAVACAATTLDSWLSGIATEKNRARFLSANQVVIMSGFFFGQFLVNAAPVEGSHLFMLAAIMMAAAVIPISLSIQQSPRMEIVGALGIAQLIKTSPLGLTAVLFCGILSSGMQNMLPIYASDKGIVGFEMSLVAASAVLGGMILQFPVGALADRFDRRTVMVSILLVCISSALVAPLLVNVAPLALLLLSIGTTMGVITCLYPLGVAETFDKLLSKEMIGAMGTLIAVYAAGSMIGPITGSLLIKYFGPDALFYFIATSAFTLMLFVLYRMSVREALPVDEQEQFVPMVATDTRVVDLDPRLEYHTPEMPLSDEARSAIGLASENPGAAVNLAKLFVHRLPDEATSLVAKLAEVDEIDVTRLYSAILATVPELSVDVAEAVVASSPELAQELVDWVIENKPDDYEKIILAIGKAVPERTHEFVEAAATKIAEDEGEEKLVEFAETVAQGIAADAEEMRPADRAASQIEERAGELVQILTSHTQDSAEEIAYKVADALPDSSVQVARAYVDSLSVDRQLAMMRGVTRQTSQTKRVTHALTQFIEHLAATHPEEAVEAAAEVIDRVPGIADKIIEVLRQAPDVDDEIASALRDKP